VEWTRAALEARVDKLAAEHEGEEFVEAIRSFGEQLSDEERDLLGRVVLDRAPRDPGVRVKYPKWSVILPRPRPRRRSP
jgi:FixJ family two-component response regulator